MLTPIALFTYNRPAHTRQALEAISRCRRLEECCLHIYCDGAKDTRVAAAVASSRQVVREWAGRLGAVVIEQTANLGLARSIVAGVSDLCARAGRVIVIEDDLVVRPDFLDYMLQALDRYEHEPRVYQISGYMFPVEHTSGPDAFFLPLTTTWGWATWQRAWNAFSWDAEGCREMLANPAARRRFDLDGSYPYSAMLEERLAGKNDSWGILWAWAVFCSGGLGLHPRNSLVWNGGFDGTGTHYKAATAAKQVGIHPMRQAGTRYPWVLPDRTAPDWEAMASINQFLRQQRRRQRMSIVVTGLREVVQVLSSMTDLTRLASGVTASLRKLALRFLNPSSQAVLTAWSRDLDSRVHIGSGTELRGARLTVREAADCTVAIGSGSNIECSIVLERRAVQVQIGSRTHIGGSTILDVASKVTVGDDVLIAFDVLIMDHDSHSPVYNERKDDVRNWIQGRKDWVHVKISPVEIADKAWIGTRSTILKGVHIGEGAIVGAGSVVTKDVPPWTIVAGNPARVIRELTEEERRIE